MITYQAERIDKVRNEIGPMLHAHYLEIATDREVKTLDINWGRYYELERINCLHIMTARDFDDGMLSTEPLGAIMTNDPNVIERGYRGNLIGYFVSFVMSHLHYQQTTYAMNDIFYVSPEHRRGLVGYKLMKKAAHDLKNLGADILTMHMKTDYPFRNLLIRQGYTLTEEIWEKVL